MFTGECRRWSTKTRTDTPACFFQNSLDVILTSLFLSASISQTEPIIPAMFPKAVSCWSVRPLENQLTQLKQDDPTELPPRTTRNECVPFYTT